MKKYVMILRSDCHKASMIVIDGVRCCSVCEKECGDVPVKEEWVCKFKKLSAREQEAEDKKSRDGLAKWIAWKWKHNCCEGWFQASICEFATIEDGKWWTLEYVVPEYRDRYGKDELTHGFKLGFQIDYCPWCGGLLQK